MNNWFRPQSSRSNRLGQSYVNSSAASIRTPLPVIIQSQRNDEVFSNKSKISRDINSSSDPQQEYIQQNINTLYQYDNDSQKEHNQDIGYRNMVKKSMNLYNNNHTGHQNKMGIMSRFHQKNILSNKNYGNENNRRKIKQSTNTWDNTNYHKPKINNNITEIYNSESSSSNYHRQYNKSKQARRQFNSKQRFKQKYTNITENFHPQQLRTDMNINNYNPINNDLNMSYITKLNPNMSETSRHRTPMVTKMPLSMDSSIRNYSESESGSNSDTIFVKKNANVVANKIESKQKYRNEDNKDIGHQEQILRYHQRQTGQYYSEQEPNQFEESTQHEVIQNQIKQFNFIRPHYQQESDQIRKNQEQAKAQRLQNAFNERKKNNNHKTDKANLTRRTTPAHKNEFENSKKWINSLNSLTSMHNNYSSNSNRSIINEDSSLVQSIVTQYDPLKKNTGSSLFKQNNSVNYSRHSHTNSKRLLTTNRNTLDRRQYIVCIIEYCSNQVGIACYNIKTGEINLTQIIQRMTYLKTVSTLERFYPQQIIFSSTLEDTLLMRKLMGNFKRTSFRPIKRIFFDQTKGYYIYTQRGNKNQNNPDHKFLAYAALNALLITMESNFQFTVTYSALNIKWHYLEEVLVIDSQTVADLQIFINKQTKVIKNTFIDNFKCLTDGGMRMLRANILQPLTDIAVINERIQLVQLLLSQQNKSILDLLMKELVKFKNYETITAKFIQTPKCQNIRSIKGYLNGIMMLSRMCYELRNLEKKVGSIIQNISLNGRKMDVNNILKNLHLKLTDQRLDFIRKIIQQNFDEQILKNYQNNVSNELNAVTTNNKRQKNKQGRNKNSLSMNINRNGNKKDNFIFVFKLDKINDQFAQISRLTYSHTIQDILKTFQKIKQKCKNEHNVKLLYNEHRGYFLSGKHTSSNQFDLSYLSNLIQDDIIHINTKNSTVTFTTSILISLNNRLKQNQSKLIYQLTELLLTIIKDIQKNMDTLFQVNYWISMLDMLIGFVGFIKTYQSQFKVGFCRPQFYSSNTQGDSPVLKIEKLRTIWTMQKFHKLSTDISIELAPGTCSLAIHKQLNSFDQLNILYSIGFMTILAQIGCLVPAESFSTSIYEILISKMDIEGNLQNKMSHFQMQLVSLRNILENVGQKDQQKKHSKKSKKGKFLVLMDEICKGTKASQQYALSLAAVQELLFKTQEQNNVSIILVSDRVLFNMLGNFQKLSLCEFCSMQELNNSTIDKKLTNQQRILVQKQLQLIQCFGKYNFSNNFLEIYKRLPQEFSE